MSSILVGVYKPNLSFRTIYNAENGLACNCKCISCDDDLIARQGSKVRFHFAHNTKNKESFACRESALHLLAKKVLSELSPAFLPMYEFERVVVDTGAPGLPQKKVLSSLGDRFEILSKEFDYKLEKLRPDIVFDLLVYGQKMPVAFEIYSNKSFLRKRKDRVIRHDLSVVEICMDEFDIEDYTLDDLIIHFRDPSHYEWVWMSQEMRDLAESNWHQQHLIPAYSQEMIDSFVGSLRASLKQSGFRFPKHEHMGKELSYLDLSGEKQVVSKMLFPAFSREYEVADVVFDDWVLQILLKHDGREIKFPVLLSYFDKRPETSSKSYLVSLAPAFPAPEDFLGSLEWGGNERLDEIYREAEHKKLSCLLGMYTDALKKLMGEVFSDLRPGDGIASPYEPCFERSCGIYLDLEDAKTIFGINHVQFQDTFLKHLERRKYVEIDDVLKFYVVNKPVLKGDESWKRRYSAIKESYASNKTCIQHVDDAISKIDKYFSMVSPESYMQEYFEKCVDLGVLIKIKGRYQVLMGYDDIEKIIQNFGVWTLAKKRI